MKKKRTCDWFLSFSCRMIAVIFITFSALVYGQDSTGTVTDIDGNIYKTIKIGEQWWMAENLKVSHFRNGESIPKAIGTQEWQKAGESGAPACCYDLKTGERYGMLYNGHAVNDSRQLAPEGWHIPKMEEFKILLKNCGGSGKKAYNALIEGGSSGFDALLGGWRTHSGGFLTIGMEAYYWFEKNDSSIVWGTMTFSKPWKNAELMDYTYTYSKEVNYFGSSIRCLKD